MGAYLGRDAILRARERPLRTEEVHVPEWLDDETGADVVLVQELTGRARDEFESSQVIIRGNKAVPDARNLRAKLAALAIVDPDTRKPMLTRDDVAELGELGAAALDRVFEVAARLSGLGEKDLEEMAGNSGTAQDGGSSSTSPATSSTAPSKSSSRKSPAAS